MMLQVLVGTILEVEQAVLPRPRFHLFYGFLAFLTVGLAAQIPAFRCAAAARCSTASSACSSWASGSAP